MKALVISHRAVLQKCPLPAIFRQSSVQNHLQQKEKKKHPFLTFVVGGKLAYNLWLDPKVSSDSVACL